MTAFTITQRIAIARGNGDRIIPHAFSAGPKIRTIPVKFRIRVEADGTYSAMPVRLPNENFVGSLFGEFVEVEPDAALTARLASL